MKNFSMDSADMQELRERTEPKNLTEEARKIKLRQIKKLFALAQSPNEAEAMAAIAKATKLMEEYRLTLSDISSVKEEELTSRHVMWPDSSTELIYSFASSITRKLTGVEAVLSSMEVAPGLPKFPSTDFIGTVTQVEIAEYTFYFFIKAFELLWTKYKKEHKAAGFRSSQSDRTDHAHGLHEGFIAKITKTQDPSAERGLVVLNKAIMDYMNDKYPRLSYGNQPRARFSEAYFRGKIDGGKLGLNKGVKDSNRATRRLS